MVLDSFVAIVYVKGFHDLDRLELRENDAIHDRTVLKSNVNFCIGAGGTTCRNLIICICCSPTPCLDIHLSSGELIIVLSKAVVRIWRRKIRLCVLRITRTAIIRDPFASWSA